MNLVYRRYALLAISLVALVAFADRASAATCESLTQLPLPHAKVTAAQAITGGSFVPTSDSLINIEIWIPLGNAWNGKYEQLGCGGFCDTLSFSYFSLARAVRRGYAGAITGR